MNFEERFPSLSKHTDSAHVFLDDVEVATVFSIQQYCLDKQRAKEIFSETKKLVNKRNTENQYWEERFMNAMQTLEFLEKELGLEGEE